MALGEMRKLLEVSQKIVKALVEDDLKTIEKEAESDHKDKSLISKLLLVCMKNNHVHSLHRMPEPIMFLTYAIKLYQILRRVLLIT